MSFLRAAANFANSVAESAARYQMQQADDTPQTSSSSRRRTIRKKESECTPCAAMANVDAVRRDLGFKTK